MEKKQLGDRITVKENTVLGVPEAEGTIVAVTKFGYLVKIDGDPPGWEGPVDFDGEILLW